METNRQDYNFGGTSCLRRFFTKSAIFKNHHSEPKKRERERETEDLGTQIQLCVVMYIKTIVITIVGN